jgi:hypothetical protein
MAYEEAKLPDCLADWIDRKMPEVGGVGRVKIYYCDSLPFEWLPGDRAEIEGITLWGQIFLRDTFSPIDPRKLKLVKLLLHEMVHVQQFRKNPLQFPINYLFNHLWCGYWDNPAEIEARESADRLILEYTVENVCDCLSPIRKKE